MWHFSVSCLLGKNGPPCRRLPTYMYTMTYRGKQEFGTADVEDVTIITANGVQGAQDSSKAAFYGHLWTGSIDAPN